ncbi:aminotransferase class I/II-fold pyridoxal phosphate-dependent enzyme [Shewanella maritima]|uniref:aminotransferase class I/II-fold pyridoxal phosphate-dependent enzyme n=1 Tax=Shewanella maritima TaxID=2520507 RepID=UPI003734F714
MTHPIYQKIAQQTAQLSQRGLLRQRRLHKTPQSNAWVDFSHNDYLGLATEPVLAQALADGAMRYGVGSKASPLVSGYHDIHHTLEQKLCAVTGHQACMLFCSGFSANSALMSSLFEPDDTVVADKLIHASIIDGIQHSGAKLCRYLHNDLASAEKLLQRQPSSMLVTESVFSMDGDRAPLAELSQLCRDNNALMIVDDAHGFGLKQGCLTETTVSQADIQVVTFGKALGCQGAAILAEQSIIDYLVATSRHYVYSTALSPASAAVALAAINLLQAEPQRQHQLEANIQYFITQAKLHRLPLTEQPIGSQSAIQPVIIGSNDKTLAIADALMQQGFKVGAIRSPTVPKGSERLRITLSSQHTHQHILALVQALAGLLDES